MKKFRFSLETVLEYKQQILDSLQAEHGAILARIRKQEEHIEALEAEYRHLSQEFNRRKAEGISILDALKYEQYLRSMERQIQEETERLEELRTAKNRLQAEYAAARNRQNEAQSQLDALYEENDRFSLRMQENDTSQEQTRQEIDLLTSRCRTSSPPWNCCAPTSATVRTPLPSWWQNWSARTAASRTLRRRSTPRSAVWKSWTTRSRGWRPNWRSFWKRPALPPTVPAPQAI